MRYCPNCREYKNTDDALFCEVCGAALEDLSQVNTVALPKNACFCPHCGAANDRDSSYCSVCGSLLPSEGVHSELPPEKKPDKKGIVLLIVLIAALLCVLGVVSYFVVQAFVSNPREDRPRETVTISPMPEPEDTTGGQPASSQTAPAVSVPDNTAAEQTDLTSAANTTTQVPLAVPQIALASTLTGSVLGASNMNSARTFDASQAIDGNPETCWCVNTAEQGGAGAKIILTLEETALVSGIRMINGNTYLPQESLYSENGQIRTFTLTFSSGESQSYTAAYNGDGSATWQTISFDEPVETDSIILRVDSGYIGDPFQTNVCLGEIEVF